jgi:putative spermidine/putrescine transport system ATP-binding protein
MDIYVRPEHLRFAPLNAQAVLSGTVVNHAFMGDHVDTYLDVNIAVEHAQRVVIRSALPDVIDRFPIGTVTALALQPRNLTVFPEVSSSL